MSRKRWTVKAVGNEANLLLIGIPVLLWTLIPIYHMVLFAISPRGTATSGRLWPTSPTFDNFSTVFHQKHFYLDHFWVQLGNSLFIAVAFAAGSWLMTRLWWDRASRCSRRTVWSPGVGSRPKMSG